MKETSAIDLIVLVRCDSMEKKNKVENEKKSFGLL